jgi:biotin operon repressor
LISNSIFSIIEDKIKQAGSSDPREVADHFGILVVDLFGTIAGYATHYSFLPVIGLNRKLDDMWYMFGGWHELTHIFDGHIYESSFTNGHYDNGFFSQSVDSRTVSVHEKTANLVSANVTISDEDVFRVTGYNTPSMCSYRELKAIQKELTQTFKQLQSSADSPIVRTKLQELRRQLEKTGSSIADLEFDIMLSDSYKSFSDMAEELGISERILHYKLEAMRLRGIDIDRQELEHYDTMFAGAI